MPKHISGAGGVLKPFWLAAMKEPATYEPCNDGKDEVTQLVGAIIDWILRGATYESTGVDAMDIRRIGTVGIPLSDGAVTEVPLAGTTL
mmetsp:Transcript_12626/g.20902  ORF Transcript_12626/g.20902 Transcript_12626/m.20902 type:complete len:89 (-) Transcript_12626:942-1208(-)